MLGYTRRDLLIGPAKELGDLAAKTWQLLSQGFHKIKSTDHLTTQAHAIEREIDGISEKNWFYLEVSVSSIYERIQQSFKLRPIEEHLKLKAAIAVRNHFHNLRLLLLEQLLGARMLINNNDYGTEVERVWQQFFQRELGPDFRVLQGGHVFNYAGDDADVQVDLLVVPVDAHVMMASSADGAKVNVLCDQVIAAIMTTSNLTTDKMDEDWQKLSRVSDLFKFTDEFPNGKEQAWPLCYLLSGQSAPLSGLSKKWIESVEASPDSRFVPQFLVSLDSGYIYSGATSWPRPRFPSNYVERKEVNSEEGIYAGLGIAWMLTQIRARAKLLQNKPHRSIQRFTKLLDDAVLKEAMPPTWAPRFNTFGSMRPIEGILHWGHDSRWAHNKLYLCCLKKVRPDFETTRQFHVFRNGVDTSTLDWKDEFKHLRWFRHGIHWSSNGLVALQEWTQVPDGPEYICRYAVFDSATGDELRLDPALEKRGYEDLREAVASLRPQT